MASSSELPPSQPPSSPGISPVCLSECVDELLRFTLASFLDGSLEIDLPFSKDYCSRLLQTDPDLPLLHPHLASFGAPANFNGLPSYPLCKHLGISLLNCIESGTFSRHPVHMPGMPETEMVNRHEDDGKELLATVGSRLINMFGEIGFELHVQEPFFSQLKAGLKSVEGRCATGNYNRIVPGTLLLFNKCLILQVKNVRWYESFVEMLETETLTEVLPGVETVQEGLQIYRRFYSEEKEFSNGVLAISVSKVDSQPCTLMANLLSGLGYDGIARTIGLVHTTGTIRDALPPPASALISSFLMPYRPKVKVSFLTTGARALAKHVKRSSDGWWGIVSGSDSDKNRRALEILKSLLAFCCWMNIHLQSNEEIFEIRVSSGYGARWSKDGSKFIGFLEPYMEDGHSKGWKH